MAQPEPPPPPPGPPPPPQPPPHHRPVLREALERAGAELGEEGAIRDLLRRRRDSLTAPLQWLLFHRPVPPLIQDGPQCGLVALWLAAWLLAPSHGVELAQLLETARARGFTSRGEMFSVADMASLAEELFLCHAEVISGGLEGPNRHRVLRHLVSGLPLLVPYDEDSNHEPCCRRGHKAHWAVLTGVLLGLRAVGPSCCQDPEIPNLFHPPDSGGFGEAFWGDFLQGGGPEGVLVVGRQGKSPRCQLWGFGGLAGSNAQLGELSPRRLSDGHVYVLPPGGVGAGLGGRALLLHPKTGEGTAPHL